MKALIVTADDVGLHPGMTEGAIRAHQQGIVTACSIVANGRAFDDAVLRLRDVPSLEVGVHLTLVEEQSLTGIRFARSWKTFMISRLSASSIDRELRAQIEKVRDTGMSVTHLNSHQHLHMLPRLFAIVARLAAEYRIPYVRVVDDRGGQAGVSRRFAVRTLSRLGRRARRPGLTNDRTIGVLEAGHLGDVLPLLNHVDGITELVTHPGIGVDEYTHWRYEWNDEARALSTATLREEIERRGIRLIAPSQISRGIS